MSENEGLVPHYQERADGGMTGSKNVDFYDSMGTDKRGT
jgi:hypothetical protein